MSVKRNKIITRFMLLLLALMVSLSACSEDQVYETDDLSCYSDVSGRCLARWRHLISLGLDVFSVLLFIGKSSSTGSDSLR